jgi:hypothetical protein
MATHSIQIVPNAFQSQQKPFFFGGSQVPETILSSGLHLTTPPKKRKISQYFKKKLEVIDLVSSSDSDNDMPLYFYQNKMLKKQEYLKERKKNRSRMID